MKFSMHNWMRPEPIETTLDRLHRYGYDGIEILGDPAKINTDIRVRKLLDKYKLECWGSVTMMFEGRDLIHADKYVRLGYDSIHERLPQNDARNLTAKCSASCLPPSAK